MVQLRSQYYKASEDNKEAERFLKSLSSETESNPLTYGYRGMAELISAKHSINPYSKINHFVKGKGYLEKAIQLSPENPELRWLRFSVQTNAPSFLAYNSNIPMDKKYLLKVLLKEVSVDADLYQRVLEFSLQSPDFTKEEKEKIRGIK
jgi:hypothetical protein